MNDLIEPPYRLTILGGAFDEAKASWLAEQLRSGVFGNALVVFTNHAAAALSGLLPSSYVTQVPSGCSCCGGHHALIAGLRDILRRPIHSAAFDRIVLEAGVDTDVEAIALAVAGDPVLKEQLHVSEIVVALAGTEDAEHFEEQSILVRQIEKADCVVVTRASPPSPHFEPALRKLRPGIPVYGT